MGLSKKSYLTPPPSNPCHPCNRSLLEAYSYRPSSLHSTRSISRARSRADQQSPAPRIIQIAHAPPTHGSVCENSRSNPSSLRRPPPISCLHFSFAEPHSRSSGIAWRLLSCPSPTHAESRNRFWTLWPPLFPFRASRALTSNCLSCI